MTSPEPTAQAPDRPASGARRAVSAALIVVGVAALLAAAGLVAANQLGDDDERPQRVAGFGEGGPGHFVRERAGVVPASEPRERRTPCYPTAYLRRPTTLLRAPGGRPRVRLAARTQWGSARVLGVVDRRGPWLGVQAPELENGELGWVRRSRARLDCSRWSLHVDLSKRRLTARRDGRAVRRLSIAVGRPDNPTPQGRFSVTDKLRVTDQSSPYGCCVLALTGHQTSLPPGWPGGDRLAVHATSDEWSVGQPVSSGCMRAKTAQARWLIHTIPLGAPIFIRA